MTATEPIPGDALLGDLLAAAPAVLATIAGADGWTTEPGSVDGAVPGTGCRAVEARVGAVVLVLVADAELARHLQVGPPPAEDLLEGAQRPLAALAGAVGAGDTPLTDVVEIDPGSLQRPGHDTAVVTLHAEGAHRATLAVVVPAAPPATEPEPALPLAQVGAPRPATKLAAVPTGLELLHDVELALTVELGRTRLLVREVLDLVPGSVIELDRAAGSPVDVLVNGTMIAKGEVVVVDEEFGVRITEVIGYEDEPLH
jgi:flagellar motor switch protein FliN/FliY